MLCHQNIWGCPNIQGASKHKWVSKHAGQCPNVQGASKHMGMSNHTGGIQSYGECPNIWVSKDTGGIQKSGAKTWGSPNIRGIQTYGGCPNIHGTSKCMWVSKHMVAIQTYWDIQKYRGHPNICGGSPNIQGASKHKWVSKHAGQCANIQAASKHAGQCPNIQGASNHIGSVQTYGCPRIQGASTHTWGILTYGGFQTYGGHPNIQVGIQTYGDIQNTGGIQTYGRCPNILGFQTYGGIQICRGTSKHTGASKHMGAIQTRRGNSCMPFFPTKQVFPLVYVCMYIEAQENLGHCDLCCQFGGNVSYLLITSIVTALI